MSKKDYNNSGGVGGTTLLALLFIGLKLTHYIDWSWKWVLSPIWIPSAIAFTIIIFYSIAICMARQAQARRKQSNKRIVN